MAALATLPAHGYSCAWSWDDGAAYDCGAIDRQADALAPVVDAIARERAAQAVVEFCREQAVRLCREHTTTPATSQPPTEGNTP